MFGRILRKDLKRNKTMNIILFLFVIIASVFFASGIYNFVLVSNGTDYMFEKAGVGDYQLISLGENTLGTFEERVKSIPEVESYTFDTTIYFSEGDVFNEDGGQIEIINVGMMNSPDRLGIRFFDKDNNEITSVEPGTVIVSGKLFRDNNLEVGDKLTFKKGDTEVTLTVAGTLKDAFMGSEFFGNPRFLVTDDILQKYLDDELASTYYGGEVFYITTGDTAAVGSAVSDLENVAYSKPTSTIKMAYVMNLIIAFVAVVLSIVLMIVSFLVLRFTINFSIGEDFREIGVMKAIGIKDKKIRSLYLTKYAVIAVAGSVIGLFLSIPFGNMLLDSMTQDMVLGTEFGYLWNVIGSVFVTLLVILFAYLSTAKIKKLTPIDAVRSGQTGERFKKKGGIRISKNLLRPSWYLALNDIFSAPKRFVTVIVSFSLCTLLVLMIVNTANTMNSDKLVYLFGPPADVYITDVKTVTSFMYADGKKDLEEYLSDLEEEYAEDGMPCRVRIGLIYTYQIEYEGNSFSYSCQQDLYTKASEFEFSEGVAPSNRNELAVTEPFLNKTGAKIGDTVKMDFGEGPEEMLITATFQSFNNVGDIVLLHEDTPTDFSHLTSCMQFKLDFTDNPDQKTIDERIQKIKDKTGNDEVFNRAEYCVDCTRVYYIMDAVAKLLLAIVLIVVILVTVLMERSFISDEKNEIAIAKAVGFKDITIIKWHVQRFFIVALVAMLLAVGLSIPMTDIVISPIFGMMGASDIEYNYDILQCFVMYPGTVLIVTVVTAFITSLYTRKIVSRDTASIE